MSLKNTKYNQKETNQEINQSIMKNNQDNIDNQNNTDIKSSLTPMQKRKALRSRLFLFLAGAILLFFGYLFSVYIYMWIGLLCFLFGIFGLFLYFSKIKSLSHFYIHEAFFDFIYGVLIMALSFGSMSNLGKFSIVNPIILFLFAIFSFYQSFQNFKKSKKF